MQNSKDLESQLKALSCTILFNFIYYKNPKEFVAKNLKSISIILNETEMDFIAHKMTNIIAPYKVNKNSLGNLSVMQNLILQTEAILDELLKKQAELDQQSAPTFVSMATQQNAKDKNTENHLSPK
jgi:hypothetical protein